MREIVQGGRVDGKTMWRKGRKQVVKAGAGGRECI